MSRKAHYSALQAVYNYVSGGFPVSLKDICIATGLTQPTVRRCRDELMARGHIKVDHFSGNRVAFKTNYNADYTSVFGKVTSIQDDAFTFLVRVEDFSNDINGEMVRHIHELNLDRSIVESIGRYVADYNKHSDTPFF